MAVAIRHGVRRVIFRCIKVFCFRFNRSLTSSRATRGYLTRASQGSARPPISRALLSAPLHRFGSAESFKIFAFAGEEVGSAMEREILQDKKDSNFPFPLCCSAAILNEGEREAGAFWSGQTDLKTFSGWRSPRNPVVSL